MTLEGFFHGIMLQSKKAAGILIGDRPADLPSRSKPGSISLTDAGRLPDGVRGTARTRQLERQDQDGDEWVPPSARNWPVIATITHAIDSVRHRLVAGDTIAPDEAEAMVMHRELPAAEPHPAKDRDKCGLCISYQRAGRAASPTVMVPICPGCGGRLGSHTQGDCSAALRDFGIVDDDWQTLPGQGPTFDEWWESRSRSGGGGLFV